MLRYGLISALTIHTIGHVKRILLGEADEQIEERSLLLFERVVGNY